jgi:hypothetical protein
MNGATERQRLFNGSIEGIERPVEEPLRCIYHPERVAMYQERGVGYCALCRDAARRSASKR